MAWIQLTLSSSEEHAPRVGDMLMGNGAQAVTYRDGADTPIFEPRPGEVTLWQNTLVTGLFDAEADIKSVVTNLEKSSILPTPLQYKTDALEDKDWEREWMDNFHPIQFGERLWICPSWRDIPDPSAVNILLDPGMAFGTGQHETTRLCLESIDRLVGSATESMLDVGCGTGILSIGAYRLGVPTVVGVDCDPDAVRIAVENAEINAVATACTFSTTPIESVETVYPLVVANIMAAPLIGMAHAVTGCVAPGGRLLLSGILWHQADDVREAYVDAGVEYVQQIQDGEWVLIEFIRS